mgnify:CR=1 FL=1
MRLQSWPQSVMVTARLGVRPLAPPACATPRLNPPVEQQVPWGCGARRPRHGPATAWSSAAGSGAAARPRRRIVSAERGAATGEVTAAVSRSLLNLALLLPALRDYDLVTPWTLAPDDRVRLCGPRACARRPYDL